MIRSSAVKIVMKNGKEVVIHCVRHHHAYELLKDLGVARDSYDVVAEGFLTHKEEFLDRRKAMAHALECGQLSATTIDGIGMCEELFSEDLW